MEQNPYGMPPRVPQDLPNATIILILGIASLPLCCLCGMGIVPAIIALVMSGQAKRQYLTDPAAYNPQSYSNVTAGRICAIIGLVLSGIYMLYNIFVFIIYGAAAVTNPDFLRQMQH